MRIDLEYPYNEKWKFGYLVINPDNRKTLILYNSHTDRSSTQYARYLLAVKLKRFLTEDETVDHIDNDKTNDSIENLQILSNSENLSKANALRKRELEFYTCTCPVCGKVFTISERSVRNAASKKRALENQRCCSKQCGYVKLRKVK